MVTEKSSLTPVSRSSQPSPTLVGSPSENVSSSAGGGSGSGGSTTTNNNNNNNNNNAAESAGADLFRSLSSSPLIYPPSNRATSGQGKHTQLFNPVGIEMNQPGSVITIMTGRVLMYAIKGFRNNSGDGDMPSPFGESISPP